MEDIESRTKLAIESLLDNESLTSNLDDASASFLLDWAVEWVRMNLQDCRDMEDSEVETLIEERMSAIRRCMRSINQWAANKEGMEREAAREWLDTLLERIAVVYQQKIKLPGDIERNAFLMLYFSAMPSEMLASLKRVIEYAISDYSD